MTGGWPHDERNVVTFGRLHLNTLSPTRNLTASAKATWTSRCVSAVWSYRRSRRNRMNINRSKVSKRDDGVRGTHHPDAGLPSDSARVGLDESQREASLADILLCCPPSTRRQGLTRVRQETAKDVAGGPCLAPSLNSCPLAAGQGPQARKGLSVTLSAFLLSVLSGNTPHAHAAGSRVR